MNCLLTTTKNKKEKYIYKHLSNINLNLISNSVHNYYLVDNVYLYVSNWCICALSILLLIVF